MIPSFTDTKVWRKSERLKGFVKDDTIRKYLQKSRKARSDVTRVEPRYLIWAFLLFCGAILLYHLYTLWQDYEVKRNESKRTDFLPSQVHRASHHNVQPVATSVLLPPQGGSNQGRAKEGNTINREIMGGRRNDAYLRQEAQRMVGSPSPLQNSGHESLPVPNRKRERPQYPSYTEGFSRPQREDVSGGRAEIPGGGSQGETGSRDPRRVPH